MDININFNFSNNFNNNFSSMNNSVRIEKKGSKSDKSNMETLINWGRILTIFVPVFKLLIEYFI